MAEASLTAIKAHEKDDTGVSAGVSTSSITTLDGNIAWEDVTGKPGLVLEAGDTMSGVLTMSVAAANQHKAIDLTGGSNTLALKSNRARFGSQTTNNNLDITYNAWWDDGNGQWVADDSGTDALLYRHNDGAADHAWYHAPAAANPSFTQIMRLTKNGRLDDLSEINVGSGKTSSSGQCELTSGFQVWRSTDTPVHIHRTDQTSDAVRAALRLRSGRDGSNAGGSGLGPSLVWMAHDENQNYDNVGGIAFYWREDPTGSNDKSEGYVFGQPGIWFRFNADQFWPESDNSITLGKSGNAWSNVVAENFKTTGGTGSGSRIEGLDIAEGVFFSAASPDGGSASNNDTLLFRSTEVGPSVTIQSTATSGRPSVEFLTKDDSGNDIWGFIRATAESDNNLMYEIYTTASGSDTKIAEITSAGNINITGTVSENQTF